MIYERMSTNELFEALQGLLETSDNGAERTRELQVQQLELEIQNRELREAQQQLAHSRTRYADLYDFSPIGYASLNEDHRIEEINITGGKLLGENPHKLIGSLFTQFIVPEDVGRFSRYIERCRRSRCQHRIKVRLVTRQGIHIDVELYTMATADADRRTLQFRSAILDVTKRKRAEEALRQSHSELEARIAERTAQLSESHNLLEAVLDKALDVVYAKDVSGRYLIINKAGESFLGKKREEIIEKTDADLLKADSAAEMAENDRGVIALDSSRTFETLLSPISGRPERWFQATVGPLHDRNGKTIGVVGIARDITERRQSDDAQRFLNEASAVLSASLDYETTLWSVARAAIPYLADCAVVDIVQDDRSIRRVAVAHSIREREHLMWQLERFTLDQSAAFGRAKVIRTGRPELYAHVTEELLDAVAQNEEHLRLLRQLEFKSFMCVPLIVRGKVIGSMGFMMHRPGRHYNSFDLLMAEDLADRAAIAIDNAILYSREQEANRLKDEFLATVSHELRTPLTPILGVIFKLRAKRPDDAELQSALDMIERNARGQARIVEDLLDISRMTTSRLDLKRELSDLSPIVQTAVEMVRPAAEAIGIQLNLNMEPLTGRIWCDPERIQQVVWNLLSNAMKFTPNGGTVDVDVQDRRDKARLRVSDNGVGIPPDFLPHVFERFRQADSFSTRLHGGLGLGLSIVRYIVDRHGGNVRAESRGEGLGASFIVDLPYS